MMEQPYISIESDSNSKFANYLDIKPEDVELIDYVLRTQTGSERVDRYFNEVEVVYDSQLQMLSVRVYPNPDQETYHPMGVVDRLINAVRHSADQLDNTDAS